MIVRNIRIEPIYSVHREASSFDPTTYLPQKDRSKVLAVLMSEERHQNESNMEVPEARITAPKPAADNIGEIKLLQYQFCQPNS